MARKVGISSASVQRIWAANEIKPHLTRTFKLSRDPNFEAKFWDEIGLYSAIAFPVSLGSGSWEPRRSLAIGMEIPAL